MTYETDLGALGTDCDVKIATKTGQPATTAHHDAAAALGRSFDADLAAAQPPTPATLYGVSHGDSAATSVASTGAKRMRTYNQAQMADGKKAGVTEFWHSEKVDQARLAAKDAAYMTQVKNLFTAVPAGRATINHERDNDTAFSTAAGSPNQKDAQQYVAAYATFITIINSINSSRDAAHQLKVVPVTTGQLYLSGTPAWWYVKDADEIAADVYNTNAFTKVYGWVKANAGGKPLSFGEIGYNAGAPLTDPPPPDDQLLSKMQTDHGIYTGWGYPIGAVMWFNQGVQTLDVRPKSAAQWKTWCSKG